MVVRAHDAIFHSLLKFQQPQQKKDKQIKNQVDVSVSLSMNVCVILVRKSVHYAHCTHTCSEIKCWMLLHGTMCIFFGSVSLSKMNAQTHWIKEITDKCTIFIVCIFHYSTQKEISRQHLSVKKRKNFTYPIKLQ